MNTEMQKKSILITGSTDGIGKLAAIKLAKDGHQILLHGRNGEKVSRVVSEVKKESGNENVKGFVADFSELKTVKSLSSEIKQEVSELNVLINNAGVFKSPIQKNSSGLDLRFVVNYLAPYSLTYELLPILKTNKDSRIINLSSAAQAPVSLTALSGEKNLSEQEAYAQSKLALTMWSFQLANKESDLTVLALNPGSLLNTNMVREAFGRFWSSADKGADIIYDLAIGSKHQNHSGEYFDNDTGGYGKVHSDAYDPQLISQLIEKTKGLLGN